MEIKGYVFSVTALSRTLTFSLCLAFLTWLAGCATTNLIDAATRGDREVLRTLLDKGANVNEKDKWGRTALHMSAFTDHSEILQILLDKGANVNEKNSRGFTALHYAAFWGYSDIVPILLDRGTNVNAKDKDGWTALHYAALDGYSDIVQLLLDRGANPGIANQDDKTPLIIAEEKGKKETESILRKAEEERYATVKKPIPSVPKIYLAEAKASKEIEETKKQLEGLKAEPERKKEPTKPSTAEVVKQDTVAQLEAKLAKLMETLAQLEEMKKQLGEERKKTDLLSEELAEKEKKEKDLLSKLEYAKKTPPVIVIASPEDGSKVEANVIHLSVVAEDNQGIKRLEVFINNKLLEKKMGRGIKTKGEKYSKRLDFARRIALERGENKIKICAVDSDGLSTEKILTVHKLEIRKNIWAAVIGINNYPNVRQLRYAVDDAKAFYDHLVHYSHIPAENVTLLLNEEASLTRLRSILGTHLKSKAGKDDMVIIYFAGHGATEKDVMSPDGDGLEKYLLPYDANPKDLYASALPMREISHVFHRIRSERLIFLVDSCYSGASGGRTISLTEMRANISDAFLDRIAGGKGRIILTASGANEVSVEDEKLQHGVFTYFLLEGLRGKADTDKDGVITVDEVYGYVSKHVPQATGQDQHPVKKGTVEGRLILSIIN